MDKETRVYLTEEGSIHITDERNITIENPDYIVKIHSNGLSKNLSEERIPKGSSVICCRFKGKGRPEYYSIEKISKVKILSGEEYARAITKLEKEKRYEMERKERIEKEYIRDIEELKKKTRELEDKMYTEIENIPITSLEKVVTEMFELI